MANFQSFAIVPAAGHSKRLGGDKLLLPWRGRPLIEHVLATWTASCVTRVTVVVRPDDERLEQCCRQFDVDVVIPQHSTPEMKDSAIAALSHVKYHYRPSATDVWLLAPADLPHLSTQIIDRVLAAHEPESPAIIAPTREGLCGHPALFPWSYEEKVKQLGPHEGINTLLKSRPLCELPVETAAIDEDVDTAEDYRRLLDSESE